jgi:hypothetical protein
MSTGDESEGTAMEPEFMAVMRTVAMAHYDRAARPERVVPLLRSFDLGSEGELVLISLEAWTTWFSLSYALFAAEGAQGVDLERTHRTVWEAKDDAGVRYEGVGGAGGGDASRWSGHVWFHPALQPNTTHLDLAVPPASASRRLVRVHLDLFA